MSEEPKTIKLDSPTDKAFYTGLRDMNELVKTLQEAGVSGEDLVRRAMWLGGRACALQGFADNGVVEETYTRGFLLNLPQAPAWVFLSWRDGAFRGAETAPGVQLFRIDYDESKQNADYAGLKLDELEDLVGVLPDELVEVVRNNLVDQHPDLDAEEDAR